MSDEINMTISIPTDDEGYVLLQCEHCGIYFKVPMFEHTYAQAWCGVIVCRVM